jgi:hypothetical protein
MEYKLLEALKTAKAGFLVIANNTNDDFIRQFALENFRNTDSIIATAAASMVNAH